MNSIYGTISVIQSYDSMSLVTVQAHDQALKSVVLDTPETKTYLKEGSPIRLLFKETEVIIGTQTDAQLSLQNKMSGTIENIQKGELLSKVTLSWYNQPVVAVITTAAVGQLMLKEGMQATAYVKTNEVLLSEV